MLQIFKSGCLILKFIVTVQRFLSRCWELLLLLLFSHPVVSDSLPLNRLQHARLPFPPSPESTNWEEPPIRKVFVPPFPCHSSTHRIWVSVLPFHQKCLGQGPGTAKSSGLSSVIFYLDLSGACHVIAHVPLTLGSGAPLLPLPLQLLNLLSLLANPLLWALVLSV